ncbi:hypothetical protein ACHAXT_000151 [Thalassiosira profunda]
MKNPVNRLATACPRALDSIIGANKSTAKDAPEKKRERTCSFDLDLSGLKPDGAGGRGSGSVAGGSTVGGLSGSSIAEEGSVVTFEELGDLTKEMSLEWRDAEGGDGGVPTAEAPAPN